MPSLKKIRRVTRKEQLFQTRVSALSTRLCLGRLQHPRLRLVLNTSPTLEIEDFLPLLHNVLLPPGRAGYLFILRAASISIFTCQFTNTQKNESITVFSILNKTYLNQVQKSNAIVKNGKKYILFMFHMFISR